MGSYHYWIGAYASFSVLASFYGEPLAKLLDKTHEFEELVTLNEFSMFMYQAMLNHLDNDIKTQGKLSGENFDYKCCFDEGEVKISS